MRGVPRESHDSTRAEHRSKSLAFRSFRILARYSRCAFLETGVSERQSSGGTGWRGMASIHAKAQAVRAKEQQVGERIKQGEYIFDMLKLGDALKGLGVVEK